MHYYSAYIPKRNVDTHLNCAITALMSQEVGTRFIYNSGDLIRSIQHLFP